MNVTTTELIDTLYLTLQTVILKCVNSNSLFLFYHTIIYFYSSEDHSVEYMIPFKEFAQSYFILLRNAKNEMDAIKIEMG